MKKQNVGDLGKKLLGHQYAQQNKSPLIRGGVVNCVAPYMGATSYAASSLSLPD